MSAPEDELLDVAHEAARAAAAELSPRFGHHQRGIRTKSGPTDLVSDADLAAETAIRRVLAARRPGRRDPRRGGAEPPRTATCAG